MLDELQKIQERFDQYKDEYEKILLDFHDSDTLNYYNDRFGYDNPRAKSAERGILIERDFKKMKKKLEGFAELFCEQFPSIKS